MLPSVVIKLSEYLRTNYKTDRHKEEWPPNQPSSIVNLALIHYEGTRTQQELIEISKRFKEGASCIDDLAASDSKVIKDVHKIFMPNGDSGVPKRILIEGAPGIGKTVLAKEIAYCWANGEILTEYKLVFLLYLRDPKLHKITSVNEIIDLFTSENTPDLQKYAVESRGKNVAFVFDGFDEYPDALQEHSFITKLIKGVGYNKMFINSTVVVTSRPTATLFLHGRVDRRIEILGFAKQERDKYVSLSLKDSSQRLNKYLKQHPIIDNLCYIPLHLAILMHLFRQNRLPETLTEMNEYFIINTIYRYLEKNKLSPCGLVKKLKDIPIQTASFIYKLSKLAFEGLQNNRLVFTVDEIRRTCPEVYNTPRAINGFGLLQAVQHYGGTAGETMSVNFLHYTMQEYLAALYVSRCSNEEQSRLIENTFWEGQFYFMWIMYVGIVGIKYFLTLYKHSASAHDQSVNHDKRKCLHLFQCYMEAKSENEMPKEISSVFTDGKVILNDITLLPHHISSLIAFMSTSTMPWKTLRLDNCNLGEVGMNSLFEHVIKNNDNISTLEYVDLSGKNSSPWRVYCAIIKHCCVNSLTLCGDGGMERYVKEITNSLQTNKKLQSLTLCKIGLIGLQSIKNALSDNTTLKKLNISWKGKGTPIIYRKLTQNELNNTWLDVNSHEGVEDINILYDGDHECSSETVNMSNKDISVDAVYLISFGLYNNTTVKKLNLSCNNITDDGAAAISDSLKYNNCPLMELNLSRNLIGHKGMENLSECIKRGLPLEYVDLSGNNSSPWGVYSTIVEHCSVSKLTLCGDEGLKHYVKHIRNILQRNTTLKSLELYTEVQRHRGIIVNSKTKRLPQNFLSVYSNGNVTSCSKSRVVNVKIQYDNDYECSSDFVCLSNQNIDDDAVSLLSFGLCNNITVKKLDLSHNNISIGGMKVLSECIEKYTIMSLKYADLSMNDSSPWSVYCAIMRHCAVISLTLCGDNGMEEYVDTIIDSLQNNPTLQSLTLYKVGITGLQSIKGVLRKNSTIKDLNLSNKYEENKIIHGKLLMDLVVNINIFYDCDHKSSPRDSEIIMSNKNISYDEICLIALGLCNNTTVKTFDLSCNEITDDVAVVISDSLIQNNTLQKLDISSNKITENGTAAIIDCLKYNSTLKELNLSQNQIDLRGMDIYAEHTIPLEYVDFSGNHSSPWGMYCAIIRHCCVNRLTLCGDEGMKEYVKEITVALQENTKLKSLTLYKVGRIGVRSIKKIIYNNITLKELNISTKYKGVKIIHGELTRRTRTGHHEHEGRVDINIMYDGTNDNHKCSSEVIKMKSIGYNGICIIMFGLYFNTTVKILDLSNNNINEDGAAIIGDCLQHNKTLEKLNLSQNYINHIGMSKLSKCIEVTSVALKYVDLSGNPSSPWGVYCTIIRHCCVNSLTLYGDEGMKDYVEQITGSLQTNTTLQLLTLCASKSNMDSYEGMIRPQSALIIDGKLFFNTLLNDNHKALSNKGRIVIVTIFCDSNCESSPETISLLHDDINDDTVCLLSFGLYNNTTVQKLDLSCNKITDDGVIAISECLKTNNTLQELNLSDNTITSRGAKKIAEAIKVNKGLLKLDLSKNAIDEDGVMDITEAIQTKMMFHIIIEPVDDGRSD